jgi:hypothetical protein
MIRYALKCHAGHSFDSWFASADAYDKLAAGGMISCAECGSTRVEKTLMAPAVRHKSAGSSPQAAAGETVPAPSSDPRGADMSREGEMQRAVARLRKEVEENSAYVGSNFAKEARDMHEGTAPTRAIYGEARPEEAKKLIEDGVPVLPLPFIPKRKTN